MEWMDRIILAVMAASVFGGMVQGFLRTVCSLLGLILGLLLAAGITRAVAAIPDRLVTQFEAIAECHCLCTDCRCW